MPVLDSTTYSQSLTLLLWRRDRSLSRSLSDGRAFKSDSNSVIELILRIRALGIFNIPFYQTICSLLIIINVIF